MVSTTKKILVILTVIALIATGTFAMKEIIKTSNEFIGKACDDGDDDKPVLHDDFDPKVNKKDIYVENLGSAPVYVRVKLEEAMNLTSNTWRPSSGDYQPHTYNPTANNCSHSNAADKLFHNYFEWKMGGWKYYKPATSSNNIINDTNNYTEADYNNQALGIEKTPEATIITVRDFLSMGQSEQKSFIGWIYDTDGYAYWSQPLMPNKATGLLLNGVKTSPTLKNTNYYYVINVTVEAVDIDDINMWLDGKEASDGSGTKVPEATDDGKEVINIIIGGDGGNGGDNNNTDGNTITPLKEIPGLSDSTSVDTILDFGGDQWIVLKKMSIGGEKYAMLLKKNAISHMCFDMNGISYEGSLLQKEFTDAYSSRHIPEILMNNAIVPVLDGETTTSTSYPSGIRADMTEYQKDIIFPLSYKEAYDWGGGEAAAKLYLNGSRWWLRTPNANQWYYVISTADQQSGSIISSVTNAMDGNLLALRPAIWVRYE